MKLTAALVYPHQLFRDHPAIAAADRVYLIEEPLLFTQFALHKQKLVLHRASMKFYEGFLKEKKVEVRYVEMAEIVETQALGDILSRDNVTDVIYADPVDDWLEKRLVSGLTEYNIKYARLDSPMFINSWQEIDDYFVGRGSFSMARFYSRERERRRILMEPDGKPVGGKFSFDTENRKKLPKNLHLPKIAHPLRNTFVDEAIEYVVKHFV